LAECCRAQTVVKGSMQGPVLSGRALRTLVPVMNWHKRTCVVAAALLLCITAVSSAAPESQLPPDSTIRFAQPGEWELPTTYVVVVGLLVLV
jgi:hypothetical protein